MHGEDEMKEARLSSWAESVAATVFHFTEKMWLPSATLSPVDAQASMYPAWRYKQLDVLVKSYGRSTRAVGACWLSMSHPEAMMAMTRRDREARRSEHLLIGVA